jgi:hypothetical protein
VKQKPLAAAELLNDRYHQCQCQSHQNGQYHQFQHAEVLFDLILNKPAGDSQMLPCFQHMIGPNNDGLLAVTVHSSRVEAFR